MMTAKSLALIAELIESRIDWLRAQVVHWDSGSSEGLRRQRSMNRKIAALRRAQKELAS